MRIGRYEIIEELGRGAMGVVYKASDPLIGRIVAIKIILTASLDSAQLTDYKRRFFREAQTAGRMSHPGIVTIYDIEEDEQGQLYLVMEFVEVSRCSACCILRTTDIRWTVSRWIGRSTWRLKLQKPLTMHIAPVSSIAT